MFDCFICSSKFQCINYLVIHLNIYHDIKAIKEFNCKNSNFLRSFSSLNSFKKHLNVHISIPNSSVQNINVCNLSESNPNISNNATNIYSPDNNIIVENLPSVKPINTLDFLKQELQKNSLYLTSKWYSNVSIPRNIVQTLIDDVQQFNHSIFVILKQKFSEELSKLNESSNTQSELSKIFEILTDSFDEVKTEHYRLKLLENLGVLIRPHQFVIGQRLNDRLTCGRVVLEPKEVKITMVSLRLVLKKQLEHSNFFNILLENLNKIQYHNSSSVISSFVQSPLWKSKIDDQNKITIPIFLYYDDFEVNNPLGSRAGSQKLGAVYISFACLPPELASSLNYIHLMALFKTDDKICFGNINIFKYIIEELNFLETSGIEICVNNKIYTVYFKLGLILGDNLGVHSVLGFVESFVANYPCRFCRSHKSECHTQSFQNDKKLRDPINYAADVLLNDVSLTGIKESCVWNGIK